MRILIFGDSLADGLKMSVSEQETVSRYGESSYGLLHFFPNLKYYLENNKYDLVVLIAGSNDMANDALTCFALENLKKMHQMCSRFGVLSMATTIMHDKFNIDYQEQCLSMMIPICRFLSENLDTKYIADDGIHLNELGKNQMSKSLDKTFQIYTMISCTKLSHKLVKMILSFLN